MKQLSQFEQKQIVQMYYDGVKHRDMARTFHCRETTITDFLHSVGLYRRKRNTVDGKEKLNTNRKWQVNETYFDAIDTEDKAYWLGFLYADGGIYYKHRKGDNRRRGGTLEVGLKYSDRQHIQKLLDCLESDYPITDRVVILFDKRFIESRVCINSVKICDSLNKLGCTPNKTLTLTPPELPKHLIPHFIRGYFDGDGNVYYNPEKIGSSSWSFSILGTLAMMEYIKKHTCISQSITVRKDPRENVYILSIGGYKSGLSFYHTLYDNATIYLDRKYEKSKCVFDLLSAKVS